MDNPAPIIDRQRYTRITRFFARVIFHVIWNDLILGRVWGLRPRIAATRTARYRRLARQFRDLAVAMGGVMIKLGQFLSIRVDIFPPEIIEELTGLQDEVPSESFGAIEAVLVAEIGAPDRVFTHLSREPMAAASLGQTHRARLSVDGIDRPVVVKVQRPDIVNIVNTDLEALRVVARWVMRYRPIGSRADVPALMEEFAATLWEELDYGAEMRNAQRFQRMFADEPGVVIPHFYARHCTGRVLVMENVEAIKITDVAAMAAAGIDPKDVAQRLLDTYFRMVFREAFFHADPHPGNIFVRPVAASADRATAVAPVDDTAAEAASGADAPAAPAGQPYELVFIDFGMVGRIDGLLPRLRKVLLSVTQRDSRGLTEAYEELGFFLPGADLERITEAQAQVLDQIWGRNLMELAQPDPNEIRELGTEFKDLLFDFPFQVPRDFIYLGRALSMVSGLTTALDPQINPFVYIESYGRQILEEQRFDQFQPDALIETALQYVALPAQVRRVLTAAESGRLTLRTKLDRRTEQRLERLERRTGRLSWHIAAAATFLGGTILYVGGETTPAAIVWTVTGLSLVGSWLRFRI